MNFNTHIELEHFYGEEREVEVEYDFQPAEDRTRDYPGCGASLEVTSVMHKDTELLHRITSEESQALEQWAWDDVEARGQREYEMAQASIEDRADAMREFRRELQQEELDRPRGVRL